MRNTNIFLCLLAATLCATGCASKKEEPAKKYVAAAEAALADIRPQAAQFAPEELKAAEARLAAAKTDLSNERYKAVLDKAGELNHSVTVLKDTIVSRQTQAAAATNEWSDLSEEVPKMVDAIQSRVNTLSQSRNLPKDVKKETFETAKSELASMKSMWAEASAAFDAGRAIEAADKARLVKAKGTEVLQQLGMPAPV